MATDSVANLTNRLRGSEAVARRSGVRATARLEPGEVQQRLEQVAGVSRVRAEGADATAACASKSKACRAATIRADLARSGGRLRLESERTARRRPEPGRDLPATHRRAKRQTPTEGNEGSTK